MAKFSFSKKKGKRQVQAGRPWKLLVADDEKSIHQITAFALKHFEYNGRGLEIISAYSGEETITQLRNHPDIAIVLLDVVMESDDSGLLAIERIRKELGNRNVRIVLRTGQPGQAPEREVIEKYDINDYKEKTELTQDKLYTTVRMGLKSYEHIITMQKHMCSLEYIVEAAPALFRITSLDNVFRSVFTAAVDLISVSEGPSVTEDVDGFIAYPVTAGGEFKVCKSIGMARSEQEIQAIISRLMREVHERLPSMHGVFNLKRESFAIPIADKNEVVAIIFLDQLPGVSDYGQHLLNILAMQAGIAFRNIDLYEVLSREHMETINLLAVASEYKDEDTGEHIRRIEHLIRLIAGEMGMEPGMIDELAQASILHDIGKLSVPDAILRKPEKLTKEEFEQIKQHTVNGAKILAGHSQFRLASEIAATHHEAFDGSGYPNGLSYGDIPFSGRLVALADVYDALVNVRPYKDAWPRQKALDLIRDERGKKFDPDVVDAFMRLVERGLV
jgi:response regulator RpfG family c-di-GMP phosphodiesterase